MEIRNNASSGSNEILPDATLRLPSIVREEFIFSVMAIDAF